MNSRPFLNFSSIKALTSVFILLILFFSSVGVNVALAALIFVNKTTANGLGDNFIRQVYIDGNNVYAGGWGGLSISANGGNTFVNKSFVDGLGADDVYAVFADGNMVYAGTAGGLSISKDGGKSFNNKTTYDGLGSNSVFGVYVVGNTIYAATAVVDTDPGGLSISTNGGTSFINKTTADGLGSNDVGDVYVDGEKIYLATFGGVSISTDGGITFVNKTTANGLGSNYVTSVFADGNKLYAATLDGLSISTNGGASFVNKTVAKGLGSNWVNDVYVSGNTIYVATDGGLSISTDGGSNFTNKTTTNGLGDNTVMGVYLYNGTIYVATANGLSLGKNTITVRSYYAQDGWILESSENSNRGGKLNVDETIFILGDNGQDKQYRSILHFDTSNLPNNAVVTKATLKIRMQKLAGSNPFTVLGNLQVDISKPYFGTSALLEIGDFQATADKAAIATFRDIPINNWYIGVLNPVGRSYINVMGTTQFRLRFAIDDNDDNTLDYLSFYSGEYDVINLRPTLIVEYYTP